MQMTNKKPPKNFLKLFTAIFLEITEPIIEPIIPKIIIKNEFLKFIFFFLRLKNILVIAEGIKQTRFVA